MIYESKTNVELMHDLNEIHKKLFEFETHRTDAHQTKADLKKLSFQLGERFKELNCLCEIYKCTQKPEASIPETLQGIADLIPPAYQYPDITCARIILDNQQFTTPHFKETVFKLSRPLVLVGRTVGSVEVYYTQKMPECDEGPFLKEEVSLLNAIVEQLQKFIDRYHVESQIHLTQFTMDTAGEAIVWVRQDGHYHYANKIACTILGYSLEELLTMSVGDTSPAQSPQGFGYYWEKLKKEGAIKQVFPYRSRTGNELFLEFQCNYLEFRGREYGCAFFHDISDKIRTDEEIKKSKAFLENILSAIADGFLVTYQGRVFQSNRVAEEMLGYQEGELLGKSMAELIPNDKAHAPIRSAILESHRTGDSIATWETDFCKKEGGLVPVEFSLSYLKENETITGAVVSLRDITERKRTQALLQRFAVAVQQTIDGVAIADMQGNILFANESWTRMHGFKTPEELIGRPIKTFHTQNQVEQDVLPFLERTNINGSHQGSVGHVKQDGAVFPTWMTTTLLKDDANDPIGIIGIARDTTERDQVLEELNQTTLFLENIYQTVGEGLVISDMAGYITRVNQMFLEMVGYSEEELIGKHFSMLVAEEYKDRGNPFAMQQLVANGFLKNLQVHYKRKDGSTFTAENNIVLFKKSGGAPQGAISSIRDITERKEAEKNLAEREERFRTLVENIPGVVYRCANVSEWTMEFISDTIMELSGFPAADFLNNSVRSYASIIHPEDRAMVERIVHEGIKAKAPYVIEYRIMNRTGNIHWVYEKGQGIFNDEGVLLYLDGAVFDITELQQAKETLVKEIEDRKVIEKELRARDEELVEVNQALKVLLKRTEADKREIEERVLFNVKELVVSYIEKLKNSRLDERQTTYLNIIESNLNNIISPFGQKLSVKYAALTPSEIHIANLIKEGKSTKEIADILHLSYRTIDFHRKNIRHKLGITNAKANLRSMLLSLQ